MVRFIFFCMAVMALSLAAIPFTNMVGDINNERTDIIASAEPAAGEPQPDAFAAGIAEEPSADTLNAIESAAGETAAPEDTSTLSGGFGADAPKALEEAEAAPVDAAPTTPQDN